MSCKAWYRGPLLEALYGGKQDFYVFKKKRKRKTKENGGGISVPRTFACKLVGPSEGMGVRIWGRLKMKRNERGIKATARPRPTPPHPLLPRAQKYICISEFYIKVFAYLYIPGRFYMNTARQVYYVLYVLYIVQYMDLS